MFNLTTFKGIINGVMKYKVLNLHVTRIYFYISLCKSLFYDLKSKQVKNKFDLLNELKLIK